jgi:hypothetical protein
MKRCVVWLHGGEALDHAMSSFLQPYQLQQDAIEAVATWQSVLKFLFFGCVFLLDIAVTE